MRSKNWALICTAVSVSFVASAAWAQCGEPNTNDCCAPNKTPGCSDQACCDSICTADPFCCDTQWDSVCANAARDGCDPSACGDGPCGDPAAGDCCSANGTPGCSDATCCTFVCGIDPLCCDTVWDQLCADLANAICECTLPCPADLNGDSQVNGSDLTALLGAWGAANGSSADLNGDGQVNGSDLTALLGAWGKCAQ